jgi:uncharacterized protein YndB with AHSA1/START domain
MSDRSVTHDTFAIERRYDASPARVFAAFANKAAKARWFAGPDEGGELERTMDFRVGGREILKGRWHSGMVSTFEAVYHDIVPDERIVYTYTMHLDARKISVSLATIEFKAAGTGTRLLVTEQGAFLDGYEDKGSREHGTGWLLDKLRSALPSELTSATTD